MTPQREMGLVGMQAWTTHTLPVTDAAAAQMAQLAARHVATEGDENGALSDDVLQ